MIIERPAAVAMYEALEVILARHPAGFTGPDDHIRWIKDKARTALAKVDPERHGPQGSFGCPQCGALITIKVIGQ